MGDQGINDIIAQEEKLGGWKKLTVIEYLVSASIRLGTLGTGSHITNLYMNISNDISLDTPNWWEQK